MAPKLLLGAGKLVSESIGDIPVRTTGQHLHWSKPWGSLLEGGQGQFCCVPVQEWGWGHGQLPPYILKTNHFLVPIAGDGCSFLISFPSVTFLGPYSKILIDFLSMDFPFCSIHFSSLLLSLPFLSSCLPSFPSLPPFFSSFSHVGN